MTATARVELVGDPTSLLRALRESEAAVAKTTAALHAAGVQTHTAYAGMSGAGKKAAGDLEQSHKRIASSFGGIGHSALLASAGIVGVGAAIEGVKHSASTLEELAKETLTLHNVTGLSVKSASAYAAVAQAQNLPVKALNQAFGTLSKNIHAVENAHSGATKAAKTQENAFKQLGLPLASIQKAHGDLNKLLPEITERFEHLPGSVNKAAIGMALFGRGWQTLVPLMHSGVLGLKEQLDVANKMGATLGGVSVKSLKEFQRAQEESKYATLGLQLAVGQYLAPALTKVITASAHFVASLKPAVEWMKHHETAVKAAAYALGSVLGLALTVFAYTRATAFVGATKDMVAGLGVLASRMGLTAAAVTTADGEIVAANATAGASFSAMLGPIGLVAAGVGVLMAKTKAAHELFESLGIGGSRGIHAEGPSSNAEQMQTYNATKDRLASHSQGGIMGFFISKGLSPAAAAGIAGNVQQESNFNPNAAGGGLFQDIGSRAASGRGSTAHQLEAAWRELQAMPGLLAALKNAKDPAQAARLFSEQFERPGTPMLSNRERYAREAYSGHPQTSEHVASLRHQTGSRQTSSPSSGMGYIETTAAGKAHKAMHAAGASPSQIDKWAEQSVGHFAESWGKNTGPELDKLQAEFHTHAAAWCAEFATTAAMMGGASKAVKTASVQTIREWAEAGTHGYKKGVGHTPHVGDLMMFGNDHVGFVSAVHGSQVSTIEGNTSAGHVSRGTRNASEGTFASPVYAKTGAGAGELKEMASRFGNELAKLILSPQQQRTVRGLGAQGLSAHEEAGTFAGYASGLGSAWQRQRGLQTQRAKPLGTTEGNREMTLIDTQDVLTAKSQKAMYAKELVQLTKEAKTWQKARDYYRRIARHAPGKGKHEALLTAAAYDAKVKEAQGQAKELEGTIADSEAAIEGAETTLSTTLPAEIQGANLGNYQAAITKISAEERAGLLTPEQAKAAKIATAQRAEQGGYGALSGEGLLQVKGDLREFAAALNEGTEAVKSHTEALEAATKTLAQFTAISNNLAQTEVGSLAGSLAESVNGGLGGIAQSRRYTPGAGIAARY